MFVVCDVILLLYSMFAVSKHALWRISSLHCSDFFLPTDSKLKLC